MSGEASRCFRCFGGTVTVHVGGRGLGSSAERAALDSEAWLLDAHRRLSRFDRDSELCELNRDPRTRVPASPLMIELAVAVRRAGFLSGGIVDATQIDQIESAGYAESLRAQPDRLDLASFDRPADQAPAGPSPRRAWRRISVDRDQGS